MRQQYPSKRFIFNREKQSFFVKGRLRHLQWQRKAVTSGDRPDSDAWSEVLRVLYVKHQKERCADKSSKALAPSRERLNLLPGSVPSSAHAAEFPSQQCRVAEHSNSAVQRKRGNCRVNVAATTALVATATPPAVIAATGETATGSKTKNVEEVVKKEQRYNRMTKVVPLTSIQCWKRATSPQQRRDRRYTRKKKNCATLTCTIVRHSSLTPSGEPQDEWCLVEPIVFSEASSMPISLQRNNEEDGWLIVDLTQQNITDSLTLPTQRHVLGVL